MWSGLVELFVHFVLAFPYMAMHVQSCCLDSLCEFRHFSQSSSETRQGRPYCRHCAFNKLQERMPLSLACDDIYRLSLHPSSTCLLSYMLCIILPYLSLNWYHYLTLSLHPK